MIEDDGNVVVIQSGSEKAGIPVEIGIAVRQAAHMLQQLRLTQPFRHREDAVVSDGFRDIGKQVFDGLCSDGGKHVGLILICHWQVTMLHDKAAPLL